jgi:hypothetical protein
VGYLFMLFFRIYGRRFIIRIGQLV